MTRRETPVQRPTSSVGSALSLLALGLWVVAAMLLTGRLTLGIMVGALAFLGWRMGVVRLGLNAAHRRGMALSRAGRDAEALAAFEQSERFWRAHPLLDGQRALLLGSASRYPFAIQALYNQCCSLVQLGRADEARRRLARLLDEQSQMGPAVRMLNSLSEEAIQPPEAPALEAMDPDASTWRALDLPGEDRAG